MFLPHFTGARSSLLIPAEVLSSQAHWLELDSSKTQQYYQEKLLCWLQFILSIHTRESQMYLLQTDFILCENISQTMFMFLFASYVGISRTMKTKCRLSNTKLILPITQRKEMWYRKLSFYIHLCFIQSSIHARSIGRLSLVTL